MFLQANHSLNKLNCEIYTVTKEIYFIDIKNTSLSVFFILFDNFYCLLLLQELQNSNFREILKYDSSTKIVTTRCDPRDLLVRLEISLYKINGQAEPIFLKRKYICSYQFCKNDQNELFRPVPMCRGQKQKITYLFRIGMEGESSRSRAYNHASRRPASS